MKRRLPQLGKFGTAFFSLVHIRHLEVVRLGDLQDVLKISSVQEQQLLERLCHNGFIIRLTRGVFLVPDKIPPGGYWQPNAYYLVTKLMQVYGAKYYIGGMSAMHFHGLTTQIPNEITIYNNKIHGKKMVGAQQFYFIKTRPEKLNGTIRINFKSDHTINIASLARTILDAIIDWKRLGSLPEAYEWIKQQCKNKEFIDEFIHLASRHANITSLRRIGYCLEAFGVNSNLLKSFFKKLTAKQGWTALNPNEPLKGKTNRRWRIINNVKKL